jgi:8-oxo-dGTP pyrophosphatase MutT (NUDIX family)
MSVRSKPYANIQQITAHLTVRSILNTMWSLLMLVGDDEKQVGKFSQPGGAMNLLETNPFFAAIREALEELGYKLFFVLTNRVPQMHYTCFITREPLYMNDSEYPDDPRHPGHPDYNGHPVTLRFNFEVLEVTGNDPEQNDPHEMHNPRYQMVNRHCKDDKRACFWLAVRGLKAFKPPEKIEQVTPDFDVMYKLMTDENGILNVDPKDAYTWTDHRGLLPYQELQPFDEYWPRMDKAELSRFITA